MSIAPAQIETIVRQVLAELQFLRQQSADTAGTVAHETTEAAIAVDRVQLTESVITESVLTGADTAGRTVMLTPGAIITPSGRDYIRRHGIRIDTSPAAVGNTSGTIITDATAPALQAAAASSGWRILRADSSVNAAVHCLPLISATRVICATQFPAVTACLLNRSPQHRVAVLTREDNIAELVREMNPQVVCLNPVGWAFSELLRLTKQLRPADVRPQSWSELFRENPA